MLSGLTLGINGIRLVGLMSVLSDSMGYLCSGCLRNIHVSEAVLHSNNHNMCPQANTVTFTVILKLRKYKAHTDQILIWVETGFGKRKRKRSAPEFVQYSPNKGWFCHNLNKFCWIVMKVKE